MARYIGKEMSRVDGVAKVTGQAKYAAEFRAPRLAYGFIVQGTVAKGAISSIDTREAEAAPGVVRVFTHLNASKLGSEGEQDLASKALQSDRVVFNGQLVALVVGETFEQARYAARLVRVTYAPEPHATDTDALLEYARVPGRAPGVRG